jgi:hypothetical protein
MGTSKSLVSVQEDSEHILLADFNFDILSFLSEKPNLNGWNIRHGFDIHDAERGLRGKLFHL